VVAAVDKCAPATTEALGTDRRNIEPFWWRLGLLTCFVQAQEAVKQHLLGSDVDVLTLLHRYATGAASNADDDRHVVRSRHA
jgi:hypothetical protein